MHKHSKMYANTPNYSATYQKICKKQFVYQHFSRTLYNLRLENKTLFGKRQPYIDAKRLLFDKIFIQ
jgi:hypothetical protein